MLCCCFGLVIELQGVYLPKEKVYPHNIHHATMYTTFGLVGLVGLLKQKLHLHVPDIEVKCSKIPSTEVHVKMTSY